MNNHDDQLKLQAHFDGELPEPEARAVANWLARDREAVALLAELRNTRKALKGFESDIKLPETREFYWSKIEREIAPADRILGSIEYMTSCGVGICGKCSSPSGALTCVDGPFLPYPEFQKPGTVSSLPVFHSTA